MTTKLKLKLLIKSPQFYRYILKVFLKHVTFRLNITLKKKRMEAVFPHIQTTQRQYKKNKLQLYMNFYKALKYNNN